MKKLRRHLLLLLTAALVACGGPAVSIAAHRSTPTPGAATAAIAPAHLLVRQGQPPARSIQLLDTGSGRVRASYPDGVATGDWSRLFVVTAAGSHNRLEEIDLSTGHTISTTATEPGFALPRTGPAGKPAGLSPNGSHLVLAGVATAQDPPATNRFLVYDTGHLDRGAVHVTLSGSFLFDGINNDGTGLYLLEDLSSPTRGGEYHVRRYDLTAGALDPASIVDKSSGEQSITGSAIDSVTSRDGAWQYTVYAFGGKPPFVHALNLDHATAFCVDLPAAPLDEGLDLLWSVVASHSGRFIYAVNAGNGAVVEMAADSPWQVRQALLPVPTPTSAAAWIPWAPLTVEAKRLVEGAAVISPDDRTLYSIGDTAIYRVDTARLQLEGSLLAGQALNSLAISPDGRRLYATSVDSPTPLLQVDVQSGRWASIGGPRGPVSVLRALS
ncbi:MAG: YncE family protein [Candidatus Dormibacteria bacterium]